MIPRKRGLKGKIIFIIFYLTILVLIDKRCYMIFLGGRHVVLSSGNYINSTYRLFGVSNSCALGWKMEMNGWRRRAIVRWL
jgi:hypothetical protein